MNRRAFFIGAGLAVVMRGHAAHAQAQAGTNAVPEAGRFIDELTQRGIQSLTDRNLPETERRQRFRRLLVDGFDTRTIALFALGRYRRLASPQEQEEFVGLYEDFLVQTYAARFTEYSGEQVRVVGSALRGEDVFVASDVIRPRGGESVRVDWVLRRTNPSFKIVDVRVAGVSLANTHRDEFGAVIQRGGGQVSALIQNLRERARR
jgi:phospholipid transport system substrate-binding protein